jgi:hypothetical protein
MTGRPEVLLRVRDRQVVSIGGGRARVWRVWGPAWLGVLVLAFVNGTVRIVGYQPIVGETAARQIATGTLVALIGGYVWLVQRRAPLPDTGTAAAVGGVWALWTLGFEFGFGHDVLGTPWAELLADYDLSRGRIWVLVPLTTAVAPPLVRAMQARRAKR